MRPDSQLEQAFSTAVLNTVDTLIAVFDRDGRIVRFNHACEQLTGYIFAEVQERPFWELLLLPEEKAAAQADFARLLAGQFPDKNEYYWTARNGRRHLIAWSNTAFRDADGEVAYIISAGTDISEREQTALLLNASESLQRVTTALLQHLTTLDDVLSIVCAEACRLTGAGGSAVLLLEDESGLQVKSSCGTPLPVYERLSITNSFAGTIVQQRKPLLLNDPQSQPHAYQRNPAIKTILAVPLCVDETILGVLDVINKPGGFTEADMRLMRLFADQAAISIEHAQLHQQAEKLAVIEERQRLARELHDSVTQAIYSVTLYADAARMALAAGKHEIVADHLRELRNMAREAMLDMRLLIFELHPPVLEKEGLAVAVQTRLETVEARSGLHSTFHVEGQETRLPLTIEEDLYRIVQEALTNAVKHARAQQVTVRLRFNEHHFGLEIRDDGVGFDPTRIQQGGGLGLRGIEERVQHIGGQLIVNSAPDKGTILQVEVDL
ncbi:MAG: GAF domain-containing protein [Ardenticatenaceae bacterium]|nr:GAF domain-containing protein [Ardenticatenaceae bacterium]